MEMKEALPGTPPTRRGGQLLTYSALSVVLLAFARKTWLGGRRARRDQRGAEFTSRTGDPGLQQVTPEGVGECLEDEAELEKREERRGWSRVCRGPHSWDVWAFTAAP